MSLLRKITAVLAVPAIEPSLAFFEKLGLECTVRVPHGEQLGFVILAGDGIELMLQSHASVADDLGSSAPIGRQAALFIEVADLDAAFAAVANAPVFLPRRTTFYGATEIGVTEPGGHHVTLAQFPAQARD